MTLTLHLQGPNGASVRPNGPFLQELVRSFQGKKTVIYRLPEGMTESILLAISFTLYQVQNFRQTLFACTNIRIITRYNVPYL